MCRGAGHSLQKPPSGFQRSLQKSSTSTGSSKSSGSRGRPASGHAINGRHVRVHCCCKFVEADSYSAAAKPAAALNVLSHSLGGPLRMNGRHVHAALFASHWATHNACGADHWSSTGIMHACDCDSKTWQSKRVFKHAGSWLATGPGGAAVAAVIVVLAAMAAGLRSWSLLLTLVNLGLAVLHLARSRRRQGALVLEDAAASRGRWQVKLVRAEIVADEPWSGSLPNLKSIPACLQSKDS